MKSRKVRIADRIEDIVNRLADEIYSETLRASWEPETGYQFPCWFTIWLECYKQVSIEFAEVIQA